MSKERKIIHLWCSPRTLSTATMYSFAQRSDTLVFDEPLYASYLAKNPEISRPYREQLLREHSGDGQHFLDSLGGRFVEGKSIILCKHITKQLDGIRDRSALYGAQARHVFLIRDPLDIIQSWNERKDVHNEGCTLDAVCFPQMAQLFSELRTKTGRSPVVLDSNLLKSNAEDVLRLLCKELEIDFMEEQLAWQPGPKPHIDGLWAPYWYEQVHKSSGFSHPGSSHSLPHSSNNSGNSSNSGSNSSLPSVRVPSVLDKESLAVFRETLPFYKLLYRHALGRDPLSPHSSAPQVSLARAMHRHGLARDGKDEESSVSFAGLADSRNADVLVWLGETLVPREEARLSVFDSAVQGGDAAWEGVRVYGGRVHALEEHIDRLLNSAHILAFSHVPSRQFIRNAIFKTLQVNGMFDDAHMRITLTRGVKLTSSMNPVFNCLGPSLVVLAEWKPVVGPATYDNQAGVKLVTASGRRHGPACLDSKIHHNNLLNNILPKIQANLYGAADALMLDDRGFVAETNATNVFLVKDGHLLTPRADACLPGITRNTVLSLATQLGISASEANLSLAEFYIADEVFTTGTMGELTPVIEIDGRRIGQVETFEREREREKARESGGERSKWPVLDRLREEYRKHTETSGVVIPR